MSEEEEMGEDIEESDRMEEGFSEHKSEEEEKEEQQVEVNPEAEESRTAVAGDSESSAPESDGALITRDRGSFVLESDNVDKSDEGSSSTMHEAVEVHEVEDATAPSFVSFHRFGVGERDDFSKHRKT
ncbi:cilia- and flagella-associated protein 251-like [Lacerta agilis]|uniref:cilia- and flagella-associated protein 251-like n=1 Tax=Lacerta agilis TaxID=80427 RepID=UPI00141A152A|nr:cilia- and flagella-associated protein 251-like [Lacerta agilis]